ncbi:MAG: hypothetical protein L6Q69_21065, partial [Zoogloea sp.]|nr:hypothetical protein [Zoogloea sp.]
SWSTFLALCPSVRIHAGKNGFGSRNSRRHRRAVPGDHCMSARGWQMPRAKSVLDLAITTALIAFLDKRFPKKA